MSASLNPFRPAEPLPFDDKLIELYLRSGRSVDDLAYTETFAAIYAELRKLGDTRSESEVFRRLLSLRKAGLLPRIAGP